MDNNDNNRKWLLQFITEKISRSSKAPHHIISWILSLIKRSRFLACWSQFNYHMTVVLKAIRLNILQFARDLRLIRLHSLYMSCVLSCFFGSQIIFNLVHYVIVVVVVSGQISDALFFNFWSVILINELRICWSLDDV